MPKRASKDYIYKWVNYQGNWHQVPDWNLMNNPFNYQPEEWLFVFLTRPSKRLSRETTVECLQFVSCSYDHTIHCKFPDGSTLGFTAHARTLHDLLRFYDPDSVKPHSYQTPNLSRCSGIEAGWPPKGNATMEGRIEMCVGS